MENGPTTCKAKLVFLLTAWVAVLVIVYVIVNLRHDVIPKPHAAVTRLDSHQPRDGVSTKGRPLNTTHRQLNTTHRHFNSTHRHLEIKDGHVETTARHFLIHNVESGRLGNTMFHVASSLCLAIRNNLTLVLLEGNSHKLDVFQDTPGVVRLQTLQQLNVSNIKKHNQRLGCCYYDKTLLGLDPNSNHLVNGYLQSVDYVTPCRSRVLDAVTFTRAVREQAEAVLRGLRTRFANKTLVGVHVRRTDKIRAAGNGNGWTVAGADYFLTAMTYFRRKFGRNVIFVVSSADNWFRENVMPNSTSSTLHLDVNSTSSTLHLDVNSSATTRRNDDAVAPPSDVYFLTRAKSAAVDLETLSRCDHVIMSVGTFGWWAAYKNNGTVIVTKNQFVLGSWLAKQYNNTLEGYLHPSWIVM